MPKIMLAEDDLTMLRLLKTLMQLEGFESVGLDDHENVLDAVHRESPDVLLLDVHLTQGNGLDFLRQMRADPRFDGLIVLMASGMSLKDECLAAGANEFLLKPFMPDTLINDISSLLASRTSSLFDGYFPANFPFRARLPGCDRPVESLWAGRPGAQIG